MSVKALDLVTTSDATLELCSFMCFLNLLKDGSISYVLIVNLLKNPYTIYHRQMSCESNCLNNICSGQSGNSEAL